MSELCPLAASVNAMNLEDQPTTLRESILFLFESKKFCDVIFTFLNLPDRIQAHEFCLKARSPEFEQIFRMRKSGNVEGNEIEIGECTPEIFRQFLEFIYADKFQVDIAGALDLLQLSRKYKVHPLTEKCEELLRAEIPIMDSVKVFETARRQGHRELMDRARETMVKSLSELIKTGALANAEEETIAELLERDDLAVEEVELFRFIRRWGENLFGPLDPLGYNDFHRNKLENLISKIRYTNMTPEEFTTVTISNGLLSSEEKLSVYSFMCGDDITRKKLKIKFNTTHRKVGIRTTVIEPVVVKSNLPCPLKQCQLCMSFKADGRVYLVYRTADGYIMVRNLADYYFAQLVS